MKKNSKGFTLVELLAVIVVLAVIMVIATTQISAVMKKSTVNSFKDSVDMVVKQAKIAYAQDTTVDTDAVKSIVDYDSNQYDIEVKDVEGGGKLVCVSSKGTGSKFHNMDNEYLATAFGTNKYMLRSGTTTVCKDFVSSSSDYVTTTAAPAAPAD